MQKNSKDNQRARDGAYLFGEFCLLPSERRLQKNQQTVPLPPKVFDALLLLVQNAERLVRRADLMQGLWPDVEVEDANLTNVIVSLRKILGREAIQTVSKFGYRFSMPVLGEPGVHQGTYAKFLEAKEQVAVRSLESMARARDLLSLCVAEDPAFAAAWAWLGRCSRFLEKLGPGSPLNLDLADAALRRALQIDPHLACAHHFYTQLQTDLGQSREAMVRLARRIAEHGEEPESFAGLVQTLRYCGLLEESLRAHQKATALDATIVTSVQHTHFLRCEYEATLDTYLGTRYYLDAAAWAALGDRARARTLLAERLREGRLSPTMLGLMSSLLAVLEGRRARAMAVIQGLRLEREPEGTFYLARHLAMLEAVPESLRTLQRAREEGFASSYALAHDEAFRPLRAHRGFQVELEQARAGERGARRALECAGGAGVMVPAACAAAGVSPKRKS